jgi:rod shape-determining protein MreC
VAALDGLLKLASVGGYTMVPAEVIAVNPVQDFSWTLTIDAGRNDGIEQDMSVINGQGLVGRVLKTTATTATVVLLVDPTSAVGARIAGSQEIGIVSGTGDQYTLEYQLLDPRADVRTGDALVTFGSKGGRPFAPGLPIGEVTQVQGTAGQLTRMAVVRPYVDISRISIVGVVTRPPRTDPRDSVLPRVSVTASAAPIPVTDGSIPAPLGLGGTASPAPSVAELSPSVPAPTPNLLQPSSPAG